MTISEQLTQTMEPLLDAVYEAGKKAGGGGGNRREYNGTIKEDIVGTYSYATLVEDSFLGTIRDRDTLFVRVECDIEPAEYTVVRSWASNVIGEVIPINNYQMNQRFGKDAIVNYNTVAKALYDAPAGGLVGLLHISENGELRLYSGSATYTIRSCNYKVIVEW